MENCPECKSGLVQLNVNNMQYVCSPCKNKWTKESYIACMCGEKTTLPTSTLRLVRDNKKGWFHCSCGKYLNIDESQTKTIQV